MTPLTARTPLGPIMSLGGAIALLLSMVAGLHAIAGEDGATPAREQHTAAATPSPDDQKFIETALTGGIAEVQKVKLAQERAASPQLRPAAARLEKEHEPLNAQFERIGSRHGDALPKEPGAGCKALYEKLQKLSGRQFGKAGAEAHRDTTIALLGPTQSNSPNPEIKTPPGDTLPTLKKPLAMPQDLQEQEQGQEQGQTQGQEQASHSSSAD